ncbi:MAG: hypothetical protein KGJ13_10600 [Patescibacteria group bacterium]|nr:hypothetical protein [Patescibacteria group bacterium]
MNFPRRPPAWAWVLVIALMWTCLIAEAWIGRHAQQILGGETFLLRSSNGFVTVVANKPIHFAPPKEKEAPLVQVGTIHLDHWIDTNKPPRLAPTKETHGSLVMTNLTSYIDTNLEALTMFTLTPTTDLCVGSPPWFMLRHRTETNTDWAWSATNSIITVTAEPSVRKRSNAWEITFK